MQSVCDQRLSEGPDNWRLVYKTLLLLEYMCKHGPLVRSVKGSPLISSSAAAAHVAQQDGLQASQAAELVVQVATNVMH